MVRIGTGIGVHYPGSTSGEVFNNYSNNVASGRFSHAEGLNNNAIGDMSHAEGVNNRADGLYSHTEGISSHTVMRLATQKVQELLPQVWHLTRKEWQQSQMEIIPTLKDWAQ